MSKPDRIRKFLVDELRYRGAPQDLTDDHGLIENRVLDSLGIYKIVTWIENEFGIEIEDEELVPEHFDTIGGIARLIESKL